MHSSDEEQRFRRQTTGLWYGIMVQKPHNKATFLHDGT